MRVTIEHREEAAGLSGRKRNYFVDCAVEFSEEEKAIISARSLYDHIVIAGFFSPPPPPMSQNLPLWLRAAAPLTAVIALFVAIQSIFTHAGEGLSAFLFVVAGGFWLYGFAGMRKQDASLEEQRVTIRNIVDGKRISIYASSPADAKAFDEDLREKLAATKAFITESAEIVAKQTFEL